MPRSLTANQMNDLKQKWTDRLVRARADVPELERFEGRVGRVITVNWSGKALVDFADGAWYDIPADEHHLELLPEGEAGYDPSVNSAQPIPKRQA